MRKLLALLVFAAFSAACDYETSITGLRFADLKIHCTVFSINQDRGLWLTANHCVDSQTLIINEHSAFVFMFDAWKDLAILHTEGYGVRALPFCNEPPAKGDKVFVSGHTWGWEGRTYLPGVVANPKQIFKIWDGQHQIDYPVMQFAIPGISPGNSGSPVVKEHCGVISVLQGMWDGGVSAGADYDWLKAFVAGLWDMPAPWIDLDDTPSGFLEDPNTV